MKAYGNLNIKLVGAYCPANDKAFKKFGIKYAGKINDGLSPDLLDDIYDVALSFIREVYIGTSTVSKDEVLYMPKNESKGLWLDIASIADTEQPELGNMIRILLAEEAKPDDVEEKKS